MGSEVSDGAQNHIAGVGYRVDLSSHFFRPNTVLHRLCVYTGLLMLQADVRKLMDFGTLEAARVLMPEEYGVQRS